MAKKKSDLFVCSECGNEYGKWVGQCAACGAWNSLKEVQSVMSRGKGGSGRSVVKKMSLERLDEVKEGKDYTRLASGMGELDRVLGGEGFVSGSVVLLAGEPGVGKSTLLGQVAMKVGLAGVVGQEGQGGGSVLYVSGEESVGQVAGRLKRLGGRDLSSVVLASESSVEAIVSEIEQKAYSLVIVDSIQTMEVEGVTGSAGSVSQIRECSAALIAVAKRSNVPMVLVGHVTKEGNIAGPRLLEHMVDVVLWFEGDRNSDLRFLRGVKNRYGATNEIGLFRMEGVGLVEVSNPSEVLLEDQQIGVPGSVVTVIMEGTRPLLVEIQALVVHSGLPMPRRVASGFDYNRLQTLVAVLMKRLNLNLAEKDVYVNVVGGLKIREPGADAAVCAAILSAFRDTPLQSDANGNSAIVVGEVGLLGELRRVMNLDLRVKECVRLGYGKVVGPAGKSVVGKGYVGVKGLRDLASKVISGK